MMVPIFQTLNASTPVKALLGSKPLRVFPWDEAPENVTKPYATYGVINGEPENTLGETPQIDKMGTQVDVWALTGRSCEDCFRAIRDALEPLGHMINFTAILRDPETQLYNIRMEFDFWANR